MLNKPTRRIFADVMQTWLIWLIALVLLASTAQVVWWLLVRLCLCRPQKKSHAPRQMPPVSVIVCVRNGGMYLDRLLPALLNQDYPTFEVVVVNDASTDHTVDVLRRYSTVDQRVNTVHMAVKAGPGKKAALEAGIKAARFDILLLTDVDCLPTSPHWIRLMEASLNDGTDVVLGLAPLTSRQASWLADAQQYETWLVATTYTTAALIGRPYMAVGRNVMYRRHFAKRLQFDQHIDLASGDDDLLLNPVLTGRTVAVQTDPAAQCVSEVVSTWHQWKKQKTRHISTARRYKVADQLALVLLQGSHLGSTPLTFLTLFFDSGTGLLLLSLWLCGRLLWLTAFVCSIRAWKWSLSVGRAILIDLCWPIYYLWMLPTLVLKRRPDW